MMQAIARVNRVFKDKEGGLIVDYVGIASALKAAMKEYTNSPVTPITRLSGNPIIRTSNTTIQKTVIPQPRSNYGIAAQPCDGRDGTV